MSLLLLAILLVIVVELTFTVQVNDNLSHNYAAEMQNIYAAKAGVEYAKSVLIEDQIEEEEGGDDELGDAQDHPQRRQAQRNGKEGVYDSLSDVWADPRKHEVNIDLEDSEDGGATVSIWIIDEARKLNINNLASKNRTVRKTCREQIERLLDDVLDLDDAEKIAEDIIELVSGDYAEEYERNVTRGRRQKDENKAEANRRDDQRREPGEDEEGDRNRRGGRRTDQLREGEKKGNPLYTIAELRSIEGITDDIFYGRPEDPDHPPGLIELLTTWSSGEINVNTARPEVLASLSKDVDEELIDKILERREAEPFESVDELKDVSGVLSRNSAFRHSITVESNIFTGLVRSQRGNMTKTAMAILARGDKSVTMLQWDENSEIAKALVEKFLIEEEEDEAEE